MCAEHGARNGTGGVCAGRRVSKKMDEVLAEIEQRVGGVECAVEYGRGVLREVPFDIGMTITMFDDRASHWYRTEPDHRGNIWITHR